MDHPLVIGVKAQSSSPTKRSRRKNNPLLAVMIKLRIQKHKAIPQTERFIMKNMESSEKSSPKTLQPI